MKHSKLYGRLFVAVFLSALVAVTLRADNLYIWAQETLSGVTFFYSGSIDTTVFPAPMLSKGKGSARIAPDTGEFRSGSSFDRYDDVIPSTGRAFGSGVSFSADSREGDGLRIRSMPSTFLELPVDYSSGTPISGSLEFPGQTLVSLGVNAAPFSFNTTVGSNTIYVLQSPEEVAAKAAAEAAKALEIAKFERKIRKTKKRIRKARKKGQLAKTKKLQRKLKKLRRKLRRLG